MNYFDLRKRINTAKELIACNSELPSIWYVPLEELARDWHLFIRCNCHNMHITDEVILDFYLTHHHSRLFDDLVFLVVDLVVVICPS